MNVSDTMDQSTSDSSTSISDGVSLVLMGTNRVLEAAQDSLSCVSWLCAEFPPQTLRSLLERKQLVLICFNKTPYHVTIPYVNKNNNNNK